MSHLVTRFHKFHSIDMACLLPMDVTDTQDYTFKIEKNICNLLKKDINGLGSMKGPKLVDL